MSGIRRRGIPALPGLSRFPELNVRTYVTYSGKPGVYFFSLDAANLPAVWAARTFYHLQLSTLPWTLTIAMETSIILRAASTGQAGSRGIYRPTSEVRLRDKESIEHWLTERYCLYTTHGGHVYRGEIHHQPWPLRDAEAQPKVNTVAAAANILLPESTPLLHFARQLEVLIWPLRRADSLHHRV